MEDLGSFGRQLGLLFVEFLKLPNVIAHLLAALACIIGADVVRSRVKNQMFGWIFAIAVGALLIAMMFWLVQNWNTLSNQ